MQSICTTIIITVGSGIGIEDPTSGKSHLPLGGHQENYDFSFPLVDWEGRIL